MLAAKGNRLLIIGAGAMARAIAWDLRRVEPPCWVTVLDRDPEALRRLQAFLGDPAVEVVHGEAQDAALVSALMRKVDLAFGAASYRLNRLHSELAVDAGVHWVDLGGNPDVVRSQMELGARAADRGVAVVPDCGLAPGMVNILAAYLVDRIGTVDELRIRVGGLPCRPEPPLFYGLLFSAEGLINEYREPAWVLREGRPETVPSLTGWERVAFGPPYGALEAFYTAGGSSTLVETYQGRIRELDYKTLRYPGHLRRIRFLLELGLFEEQEVTLPDGRRVSPRRTLEAVLERRLGWVDDDVTLVKIWAVGGGKSGHIRKEINLAEPADPDAGLTAMARTTGFSAAVVARMILDGSITDRGVLRQELSVPSGRFIRELARRGIAVRET